MHDCSRISTKRDAFAEFRRWPSPWIILAGFAAVTSARLVAGGWSPWDLLGIAIFVVANPFTEWMMHRYILHGPRLKIGRLDAKNGVDHAKHHRNPGEIRWLLLSAPDSAMNQVLLSILVAVLGVPTFWLLGAPIIAPTLTIGWLTSARLLQYEWSHFLFHTAYRPRTAWYRRLKRNHRLHHWRNENYWLGVTTTLGDLALGTRKQRSDVPLSPTARTLDIDPEESVDVDRAAA